MAARTASAPASTAGGKSVAVPAPPGGDDGDRHGRADQPDQVEVEAGLRAVGVHRVEQDLAGAEVDRTSRPLDRVEPRGLAAAVGGDLEARVGARGAARVEREHEHLVAEAVGDLGDQLGPVDRRGVDGHLVGAGAQQPVDVVDPGDSPADGERDEDLLGGARHDLQGGRAALVGGGDVEEGQLVGALGVVLPGQLDRVAGVAQVAEVHPLDDAPGVDVEAGDHADGETHPGPRSKRNDVGIRSGCSLVPRVSISASSRVNRPS